VLGGRISEEVNALVGDRNTARASHEVVCQRGFAERDWSDGERGRGVGGKVWEHRVMEESLIGGRSL